MGDGGAKRGTWTMIYDEGFEIEYDSVKYFAFNKDQRSDNGGYESDCSSTLIGWYNNAVTGERGCYRANKKGE